MRTSRPTLVTFCLALAAGGCLGRIGVLEGESVDGGRVSLPATSPTDAGAAAPRTDAGAATPRTDAGATTTPRADVLTSTPRPDAGTTTTPPPAVTYPGVAGVSPTLGGCPVFPAADPWNRDISGAAVHPDSDAIIASIADNGDMDLRADFGSDPNYGLPITLAPASQAMVSVRVTEYPGESDPGPFPIPSNARVEGGGDDHVLVVHQGACVLYELYHAQRSGSAWSAGAIARFDLRANTARPQGWTSADQAGLPITAGLARYDEVAAGEIRHALRVTFWHTRAAWVPPATHPGGNDDDAAPAMGMRLRLRADHDISSLTGQARVIATALKRYGLFVADTGYNWFVSGATDTRWNDRELAQLRDIPGTAFEFVDTGPVRTR